MGETIVIGVCVLVVVLSLACAFIIVVASRRSHLRNWRLGVFYEAEDRYERQDDDVSDDGQQT